MMAKRRNTYLKVTTTRLLRGKARRTKKMLPMAWRRRQSARLWKHWELADATAFLQPLHASQRRQRRHEAICFNTWRCVANTERRSVKFYRSLWRASSLTRFGPRSAAPHCGQDARGYRQEARRSYPPRDYACY